MIVYMEDSNNLIKNEVEKWKELFEILPVGVSLLDANRKIVECNGRLTEILKLSKDQIINGEYKKRKYIDKNELIIKDEDFPSMIAMLEKRIVINVEVGIILEDGSIIWTLVSAASIKISDYCCAIVTSDITERKKMEKEQKEILRGKEIISKSMMNREIKMVELKNHIKELEDKYEPQEKTLA